MHRFVILIPYGKFELEISGIRNIVISEEFAESSTVYF
jgi:hypothetical protein